MTKMQVGASTLCGMHNTPRQAVKALAERGFKCVEFVFESPHLLSSRDIVTLAKLGRQHGLDYSIHGPWLTHNLGHMDRSVQRMNQRLFSRCINAAAKLKATHFVTHGSRIQTLYRNVGFPEKDILHTFIRELRPVVKEAASKGVELVCENVFSVGETFSNVKTLFEVIKATGAGLCLDIAHAELSSKRQELLSLMPSYVHAADANLKQHRDLHLGIGKGDVNFDWWMETLKDGGYDGKIVLEVIEINDLDSSRRNLLRLWNEASGRQK